MGTIILLIEPSLASDGVTSKTANGLLSDTELFYDDPDEGATIYNTINEEYTRVNFTRDNEDSLISYSRDLTYAAEFILPPPPLDPQIVRFTVIIHHIQSDANYNISINEELSSSISAFSWSHGSAYIFTNETADYYVAAPGEEPIGITNEDDGKTERNTDMIEPDVVIVDDAIKAKQTGQYFSPSDKYVDYISSKSNPTDGSHNKVTMTTYDRFEKCDYHYNMGYVKTGDEEHTIYSIHILNSETQEWRLMDIHLSDQSAAYYAFASSWVVLHGKELFLATWANRWQNETALTLCDYETSTCSLIYEHKYEPRHVVYSNSSIFVILPKQKKDNAWQHIAKLEITADLKLKLISHIPSGDYDIRKILAYRPNEDLIIYEAQAPNPWNMHVYAAPAGERYCRLKQDQCLTCGDSDCTYQERATVAPGDNFTIDFMCNGPAPPHQRMIGLDDDLNPHGLRNITQPDEEVVAEAANRTKWIIDTFELSSGFEAIVRIYEGDSEEDLVPVTLYVYGGPDSNEALDKFEYYPDAIGYKHAIVKIDVRGSGGRGWNYRSAIYGRLVTVEVDDTIEAMEMVLDKYPRLDRDRVGVFGASYGGTMALALVGKATQYFFKCAVSVAPVTNFFYYNAVYTESFMGDTPQSSYTDLNEDVSAFEDTELLLMHGLRDDTVLFRHSALLIQALQEADILFDQMVYPNQDHSIGGMVANHRSRTIERFLERCYA